MDLKESPFHRLGMVLRAVTLVAVLLAPDAVYAQGVMRAPAGVPRASGMPDLSARGDTLTARLNFSDAPLDIVLADYSEKTGKTLLRAPGLPSPTFTLRSQGELSIDEYLKAVETVLTMHGVGLVEYGEKFVRVVPIKSIRREGMEVLEAMPEGMVLERTGAMVSQMVTLQHIAIADATAAVEPMRNENGQINAFEQINAIMITDMPSNINKMLQVLRMIDQPVEAREEPNIIQIRFARAVDIKRRLEEIIAESQEQQRATNPRQRTSGSPGVETPETRGPAGVIRPSTITRRQEPVDDSVQTAQLIAEAERGIIRGTVKIVADERTNILIIITRPENMAFFERIIAVLDVETSPDVIVRVVQLEFAEATEIAGMLNDLIGATQKDDAPAAAPLADGEGTSESRRLAEIEEQLRSRQEQTDAKSKVGELSKDNIKILSDERTNSLILMASKSDVATLVDIIADMDMMLSQVLIEAVIIEIALDDSLDTGVSWVQKALTTYTRDSSGNLSPVMSFAGGGGGGGEAPLDATALQNASQLGNAGLGYFFTLFDLNVNAVIRASASDSRSRVVSTPALLTTDNTEATLSSTERIYVFEGTTFYDNSNNSSARYRQEDVGLELTVKPQINENKVVMMEITQEASEPGDITTTDTDNLAGQRISINRKIEASIAVRSGQTIVLGGQVRESDSRSRTKIPLLGDIPLVGRLFNSDSRGKGRTETIVFITPYVLDSPEEVAEETRRRRDSLAIDGMWKQGWSGSRLAEPPGETRLRGAPAPRREALLQNRALAPARQQEALPGVRELPPRQGWVSSSGKPARGDVAVVDEALEEERATIYTEAADMDVEAFIEQQRRKWKQALDTANGDNPSGSPVE